MLRLLRLVFVLVFIFSTQFVCVGQQLEFIIKREKGFSQKLASIKSESKYAVKNNQPFTSISIQIPDNEVFDGAYCVVNKDTFWLSQDEHIEPLNEFINANLISFATPVYKVDFYSGEIDNRVLFNFINGSVNQLEQNKTNNRFNAECLIEPLSIGQQTWRSGLSTPQYSRLFSKVEHVIIHHSAGSNENTNYTQVVRDIYIYHTEVNGWSDIGYNYLIAQDGTIFKGRDPDNGAQDNVRGAHFCGMNTGTMGVCLLGNYTSVAPTNETIQSLLKLLSWKLDKEGINAFEESIFNGIDLGAVAGHRDGCATECPGTKTYQKIKNFKSQANSMIESCYPDKLIADFTWDKDKITEGESISFTDASQGNPLSWQWKLEGSINENYTRQNLTEVYYPKAGEFDARLVVKNGARTDTAFINNLILVEPSPYAEPFIYPVPVSAGAPLIINVNKEEISEVEIIDSKGQAVISFEPTQNQMEVDHKLLREGIYFVRYFSNGLVVKFDKILIIN